jgi:hypothetical protein
MIKLTPNRIRKILIPGALFFLVAITVSIHSMETEILLSPPGLRLIKDPSLVIPADFHYANRLVKLPAYRDISGNPEKGWSVKLVDTRRFASNQSAWIFFRDSDLQRSESKPKEDGRSAFRFWPVGTTIIIEIYKGNAFQKEKDKLIEIAAMSKVNADNNSLFQAFYPISWVYARFNPDKNPSITSAKVPHLYITVHCIRFEA